MVRLPPEITLPDGAKVRMAAIETTPDDRGQFVAELRAIAAAMPDVPDDWATQHDHYIHGTPKR